LSIVRMGRYIPQTLREWDVVFSPLNETIQQTPDGTTINADNLPSQDAAYVTLSNNASLTGDRVLTPASGEIAITDGGPGTTVTVGLADYGTQGTYPKVVTDSKGRVVSGADLLSSDMPVPLNRIYTGNGSPNGVVTASPGSLYLNTAGGAGTTLWVKESGNGSVGWIGK